MPNEDDYIVGEVQTAPSDDLTTALIKINLTDVAIETLEIEAKKMPVPNGIDDKETYERNRRARLDIVPLRTGAVRTLTAIREEAVAFQRKVKGKENEIVAKLQTIEAIYAKNEQVYLDAVKAKEEEEKARKLAILNDRLAKLRELEWVGSPVAIEAATDEEFEAMLTDVRIRWEEMQERKRAEEKRIADEREAARIQAEENRKEQERLAAERAEFDRQQAEAKKLIDAENERLRLENERVRLENERIARDLQAQKDELKRQQEALEAKNIPTQAPTQATVQQAVTVDGVIKSVEVLVAPTEVAYNKEAQLSALKFWIAEIVKSILFGGPIIENINPNLESLIREEKQQIVMRLNRMSDQAKWVKW